MTAKLTLLNEVAFKLDNVPVEVRKEINRALKFENPAAKYMKKTKLYGWDGAIAFFNISGTGYIHHLDQVLAIMEKHGITVSELVDKRTPMDIQFEPITEAYWGDSVWAPGHQLAGEPIRLRDYQVDAVNGFIGHPQGIQQLPTASGKTIILATLSKIVEQYGRSLIIVPNRSLVDQTLEDYVNCGLDVGVFYGGKREMDHTHTICTWQSLDSANRSAKKKMEVTANDLKQLSHNLKTVICDETHMVKGSVLKKLLTEHFKDVPIRWGLTGTIPKEPHEFEALRATLGPVINKIKPKTLQDAGYLSNCFINIQQLIDYPEFNSYPEELKYLVTSEHRVSYLAYMVSNIRKTGNTLVLVDRIATGNALCSQIEGSVFVSGEMKTSDRKEHYDSINDSDSEVIVATYQVAAVGINLVNIQHVVLIEPGKSFVRVIQSIGRGLRKSKTKDFVNIWDITSTCKFSKRHLTARKKFYKESEYDFTVKRIEWN